MGKIAGHLVQVKAVGSNCRGSQQILYCHKITSVSYKNVLVEAVKGINC